MSDLADHTQTQQRGAPSLGPLTMYGGVREAVSIDGLGEYEDRRRRRGDLT